MNLKKNLSKLDYGFAIWLAVNYGDTDLDDREILSIIKSNEAPEDWEQLNMCPTCGAYQ